MTQHFPINQGQVVHEGFFDPIQELLGASLPSLRIEVSTSSTLTINAGTGNDQVTAALTNSAGTEAGFRWITRPINATLPGGLTNGTGSVYITASDNDFSGSFSDPDAPTNYAFAMEIRASGTPTTDLWRKVGEVDVSGGSIVAFRAMGGPRPTSEFGLAARPDTASQPGVLIVGRSGQTGKLIEAKNSSGTAVHSVDNSGASTQTGGITTSSADGVTVSGSGGKDTLNLSNTDANTGITIGGDVEIYRAAANAIQTDDSVTIRRTSGSDTTLATKATSDSQDRISVSAGGEIRIGSGSTSPDVRIRRSGASAVTVDTPSGGAAALAVSGALTVGTSLTLTQATTAGHIPISNGSGLMNLGQAGRTSVQDGLLPPIGSIIQFAGGTAPTGWLFCEGQSLTQAEYPSLYAVITSSGTVFPYGGSGSNFNLPDLRGRMPVGKGTHSSVDTLGENDGTAEVVKRRPAHSHTGTGTTSSDGWHQHTGSTSTNGSHTHAIGVVASGATAPANSDFYRTFTGAGTSRAMTTEGSHSHTFTTNPDGTHSHTVTTTVGSTGGTTDAPSFVVVNYIIKT